LNTHECNPTPNTVTKGTNECTHSKQLFPWCLHSSGKKLASLPYFAIPGIPAMLY